MMTGGSRATRNQSTLDRFTSKMLWLTRKNGDMVNSSESLQGKVVGIFFLSLTPSRENKLSLLHCIQDLAHSYNELSKSKKDKFEIVLIARGKCESLFNYYLEMMPWLAVPFMHSTSRNNLYNLAKKILAVHEYALVLFDCDGQVLRKDGCSLFKYYGRDYYPFTKKRLEELVDEEEDIRANMSLRKLLGSPTRDFVIAKDDTQVPISSLEDKVVGIYYCDVLRIGSSFTQHLLEVYEQLKQQGAEFEVVLVPVELDGWWGEEYFNQERQTFPWLTLPHRDSCSRRVPLVFGQEFIESENLVICGPGGCFINMFGHPIVCHYGSSAFPFSVLPTVLIQLEEVSLRSLLTSGDRNYVISKSVVEKIEISNILGETIFLLFTCFGYEEEQLVSKLIRLNEMMNADYNVILVASGFDKSSFDDYYYHLHMSWLALPYDDTRIDYMRTALGITCTTPTLVVFGPDGKGRSIRSDSYLWNSSRRFNKHLRRLPLCFSKKNSPWTCEKHSVASSF